MNIPNIPPKKILVAYDFSPLAKKAWEMAKELAGSLGAALEAVFVYETPSFAEAMGPMPTTPFVINRLTDELKRNLLGDIRKELGEEVQATILQGFPRDGILDAAREHAIDLIVMGTHGRTGSGRVLFGSVAENLSRHSSLPVLTIHGDWRPVKSILVPLNFTDYSLGGFHAAAALAERLGARFDVLFVAQEPYSEDLLEDTFKELVKRLPAYFADKAPKLLRGGGNPAERIVVVGDDYELILMTAHRKSMFRDVILGTTAERVLRHSDTPVLAIPAAAKKADARPVRKTAAGAGRR